MNSAGAHDPAGTSLSDRGFSAAPSVSKLSGHIAPQPTVVDKPELNPAQSTTTSRPVETLASLQHPEPLQVSASLQRSTSSSTSATLETAVSLKPSASTQLSASLRTSANKQDAQPDESAITASLQQSAPVHTPAVSLPAPANTPSLLIGAPTQPQTPLESRAPGPRQSTEDALKNSSSGPSTQRAAAQSLINKEVSAALPPRTENLAFSLRLQDSDSAALAHHVPATAKSSNVPAQPATPAKTETRSPATPQAAIAARAASPASAPAEPASANANPATVNPVWSESAAAQTVDMRAPIQLTQPHESANPSTVAALHDTQPVLPEPARPTATGEILLQLGGKDQGAAIRLTDRAGAVNVSVHAADPELRSSLRSNLGELASQLSHQGWKTDVIKSGTLLTRTETSQQDTRQDGQRSQGQQQPSQHGDRQPQRDRRSTSGQWLAEFEEQASGNPGGTN
jgi:hypothetical protein